MMVGQGNDGICTSLPLQGRGEEYTYIRTRINETQICLLGHLEVSPWLKHAIFASLEVVGGGWVWEIFRRSCPADLVPPRSCQRSLPAEVVR